jgi:quinol monooxygenase YgiN
VDITIGRRHFIVMAGSAALSSWTTGENPLTTREKTMYGLIGKMVAVPGQREALISILLDGVSDMPGCLSYVVAKDPSDANAIWITEVWDSEQSHRASLSLPSVKRAIAQGKPLIASFGDHSVTEPVGGHGLVPTQAQRAG